LDRNTLLAFVLSMAVFSAWAAWQGSRQPPPPDTQRSPQVSELETESGSLEGASAQRSKPSQSLQGSTSSAPVEPVPPAVRRGPAIALQETVIETELYRAHLTNRGAALQAWDLLDPRYAEATEEGTLEPMEQLRLQAPHSRALLTPFSELGLGNLSDEHFAVESQGQSSIVYLLERDGIQIRKTYGFEEGSYEFGLTLEVRNDSQRIVTPRFRVEWPATVNEAPDFVERSLIVLHDGDVERTPVLSIGSPGFFGSMFGNAKADQPELWPGDIDWAGVDDKYFLFAILPDRPREAGAIFEPLVRREVGTTVVEFTPVELQPGQAVTQVFRGYSGPKEVDRLDAVGAELGDAVNLGYAWVSPLTRFFQWLLHALYALVGNYGVAIIVITVLVRLITLPIMAKQMKSMEGMRALQPKIQELQTKFADDRAKQSEEMMKLYKQEGVNPLGGCLPLLLQFPVFIGLFYALQSSIDLRHADFIWWITDLSAPENIFTIPGLGIPFRLLPLIMGASMVIQQRMTPMTGMDPAQAKMMMTLMPIMMTVMFYQFPSGLVLYWMISNILGIAHQLWVRRNLEEAS